MKQRLYSVRDAAAATFGRPWIAQSDLVAIRSFKDRVNARDPDNLWFRHYADHDLYYLGEFDEAVGILHPFEKDGQLALPELIAQGRAVFDPEYVDGMSPRA